MKSTAPAASTLDALAALRWGPAAADPAPGIDVPRDWRDEVAAWEHERWIRWRRLVAEMLEGRDDAPTAADIRAADRAAYDLIRVEPGVLRSP